jgi:hypothetical protein
MKLIIAALLVMTITAYDPMFVGTPEDIAYINEN